MPANKTSFSFSAFFKKRIERLSKLIDRFFGWVSTLFTRPIKRKLFIIDSQGELEINSDRTDPDLLLQKYVEMRNIAPSQIGRLAYPDADKQGLSKEAIKLYYLPKDHLMISMCKPGEERDTIQRDNIQIIPIRTRVSELLAQYEKQHKIPADKPGKLFALGQSLDPNQVVGDILTAFELDPLSLLSITYLPFKPAYVPVRHYIKITFKDFCEVLRKASTTSTIEELLTDCHRSFGEELPPPSAEQMEVLSFLGKDFKGQQTMGEVLAWAEQNKSTDTPLVLEYKICPAPVVVRIDDDRETYRIECDPSETVPSILKKYHAARHTSYEEGSLKAWYKRKTKDQETELSAEEREQLTKALLCTTNEYDLDNAKTLAEQNITAGTTVGAQYKPKKQ